MCCSAQHMRLKWTQETPQPLSLGFREHQVVTPAQGHWVGLGPVGERSISVPCLRSVLLSSQSLTRACPLCPHPLKCRSAPVSILSNSDGPCVCVL